MEPTEAELKQRYAGMETEELIDILESGGLTETASHVLQRELSTRGISAEEKEEISRQIETDIQSFKDSPSPFWVLVHWWAAAVAFAAVSKQRDEVLSYVIQTGGSTMDYTTLMMIVMAASVGLGYYL